MTHGMKSKGILSATIAAITCLSLLAIAQQAANAPPVAAFTVSRSGNGPETAVVLDASSSRDPDGNIVSYQWLFGDGFTGSGASKVHTYPRVGTYEVTLLVIDNGGASNLVTKSVDLSNLAASTATPTGASTPSPARSVAPPPNVPVGNRVGQRAPQFSLPDYDEDTVHLSDFLGGVVLLEFWFSSCPGCRASAPYLESLRQRFEDHGLVVLLVILDRNPADAETFFALTGYTNFITVREVDSAARPTRQAYGVGPVPHVFLIDRLGIIRYSGHPDSLFEEQIAGWL